MSPLSHERAAACSGESPTNERITSLGNGSLMAELGIISMALLTAVLLMGCGSARRGEQFVGPLTLESRDIQRGQTNFMKHCHQCHPGGEAGLGPALTNKPLPMFLVRAQVRYGLGAMPAFTREDLADEDLDDLLGYLAALKRHG
jgi:mono/diheme cytochrome c family protein